MYTLIIYLLQRFYQTLSEIKSEIECIIVTGRKLVKDETVPESDKFSKRIDMLKELYNKVCELFNSLRMKKRMYLHKRTN